MIKVMAIIILFVIIAGCSSSPQDNIQKSAKWTYSDQQHQANIVFNPDGTGTSDYDKIHTDFEYQYMGGNKYTLTTNDGSIHEIIITSEGVTSDLIPNLQLKRSKL